MALLNTFDFNNRANNKGKFTTSPLTVRFTSDLVFLGAKRLPTDHQYALCQRIAEKTYSWSGYTLSMARRIANFYANGNASDVGTGTRPGYYRTFKDIFWNAEIQIWDVTERFDNRTIVSVNRVDGDMYSVDIQVDEIDQFLIADNLPHASYDDWCAAFSSYYGGKPWANYSASSTTPYLFESYYDEPLTVVNRS